LGICVFFWLGGVAFKGERKGRLGKSYVDGACGGWGESLWSGAMIGICIEGSSKGRMAHGMIGIHGTVGEACAVGGWVLRFGATRALSGFKLMGRKSNVRTSTANCGSGANFGREHADIHPDRSADYVLANLPCNDSDWFRKDAEKEGQRRLVAALE
jgi:hypothetical protein